MICTPCTIALKQQLPSPVILKSANPGPDVPSCATMCVHKVREPGAARQAGPVAVLAAPRASDRGDVLVGRLALADGRRGHRAGCGLCSNSSPRVACSMVSFVQVQWSCASLTYPTPPQLPHLPYRLACTWLVHSTALPVYCNCPHTAFRWVVRPCFSPPNSARHPSPCLPSRWR